jgi:hypothetical protein
VVIGSVSSGILSQASNIKQNTTIPANSEVRGEKENDGDRDDGASSKVNVSSPTVNTIGQTIGATINVTA